MLVSRTRGWALWLLLTAPACSSTIRSLARHSHRRSSRPRAGRTASQPLGAARRPAGTGSDRTARSLPGADRRGSGRGFQLPVRLGRDGQDQGDDQRPPGAGLAQRRLAGLDPVSARHPDAVHASRRARGDGLRRFWSIPYGGTEARSREMSARGAAWIDSVSLVTPGPGVAPAERVPDPLGPGRRRRGCSGASARRQAWSGCSPSDRQRRYCPALRAFDRDTTKLRTPEEVRYVGVIRGRAIGPDAGPDPARPYGLAGSGARRAALRCVTGCRCPAPYAELVSPDSSWAVVEAALGRDTVRLRWPLQVALLDTLPVVDPVRRRHAGAGKDRQPDTRAGHTRWYLRLVLSHRYPRVGDRPRQRRSSHPALARCPRPGCRSPMRNRYPRDYRSRARSWARSRSRRRGSGHPANPADPAGALPGHGDRAKPGHHVLQRGGGRGLDAVRDRLAGARS